MIRSTAEKILLLAFWTCYLTIAIAKVAQWTMMEYILTPLPPLILMVLYAHLKKKRSNHLLCVCILFSGRCHDLRYRY
jgi:hypothetical protein